MSKYDEKYYNKNKIIIGIILSCLFLCVPAVVFFAKTLKVVKQFNENPFSEEHLLHDIKSGVKKGWISFAIWIFLIVSALISVAIIKFNLIKPFKKEIATTITTTTVVTELSETQTTYLETTTKKQTHSSEGYLYSSWAEPCTSFGEYIYLQIEDKNASVIVNSVERGSEADATIKNYCLKNKLQFTPSNKKYEWVCVNYGFYSKEKISSEMYSKVYKQIVGSDSEYLFYDGKYYKTNIYQNWNKNNLSGQLMFLVPCGCNDYIIRFYYNDSNAYFAK